jgi:3-oxoadipate enol-lactonase
VATIQPEPVAVERPGLTLAGESLGEGPPLVLLHGLTATRRTVVHGSKVLARKGYRQLSYDARGHGESDPAPPGEGYAYSELAADLGALISAELAEGVPALVGHSMGAHTAVAYGLDHADRIAGLVFIGPVWTGLPPPQEILDYWDRLADGLEQGGVEGFVSAYDRDLDPKWRETLLRITRQRLEAHRHPEAVAQALREVSRAAPFETISELEFLDVPALVVASHDDADPGHPYAVAEAWAERLPQARLISEERGESPLAWQGGRLAREIASFCSEPAVAERRA